MRSFSLFLLSVCIISGLSQCSSPRQEAQQPQTMAEGTWQGTLDVQGQDLKFNFTVGTEAGLAYVELINAGERIKIPAEDITYYGDSVRIVMHIFDTELRARVAPTQLTGLYAKNYADYTLPFEAQFGVSSRVVQADTEAEVARLQKRYMVQFDHEGDITPAIGEFSQQGNYVVGTFLTETGDYRYLEGGITNTNELTLTTFDGNHAFVFQAKIEEDQLIGGHFYSGATWHETWTATANPDAQLRDANTLTYLKEGYDGITFAFPDTNGDTVRLSDDKYQGKVVILQIFGTWCPNCMDETRFYKDWYDRNQDRGVEIIGLAYETRPDFDYASKRVIKMQERLGVNYDFLVAGTSDKEEAAKTLPMLNHIMSFPTSIFINRQGEVVKIHTGFSGPGTGEHYTQWVEEFQATMEELLHEAS